MSRYAFAFTKENKQIFVPNGDQTRYVIISGCPTESVNGTYYQMDPITINGETYNLCFTNGTYMLTTINFSEKSNKNLYELDNSSLIKKFSYGNSASATFAWFNSETLEHVPEMNITFFGDWETGMGGGSAN